MARSLYRDLLKKVVGRSYNGGRKEKKFTDKRKGREGK